MRDKIFTPKTIKRNRIDNMLSQIFEVPIFFISASMGYGKTTAVKDFLEKKKEVLNIWFYSANENNDDVWIWQKFCCVIKCTNPTLGSRLLNYGFPKNNMEAHEIIDIIKAEIKQKTVLVIDDWYDKKTVYINNFIKIVALEAIDNFHIVIISRNRPTDEYLELESKQKCIVMWQEDISFTFQETAEFFEINGMKLNEDEKREVYEYTGGWTSATYLSLFQYYNKNTFHNIPKATELIKTAVFNKFDETTKQILLKLVPVENFTIEQAIYITGDKKANNVIEYLLSNNCFIKYDNKLMTYRLHSILRSVLNEEFLSSNLDFKEIYNLCGDWYSSNSRDMSAIEYYFKAKNYNRVLDLIERNNTIDLTNLRQRIINSVFDELSLEEKISRPIAYLTYIFFYILYGNPVIGKNILYETKVIYEKDENLKDKNQIMGEIAFVESILMFKNLKVMTQYHKKAYELFNGGTSKIANNKIAVTFGSPHFLCLFYRKNGELKEMVESFDKEVKYFIHISEGGATGSNYLMRAEYLFETGDTDNAEFFAYKALHKARDKKQTSIIICIFFLLMRIYVQKNNRYEAKNYLNNLIKEYENCNIPSFLNGSKIALGYINGITNNLESIDILFKDTENLDTKAIIPVIGLNYVIFGLAMILKKSYIELEVHVETMLEVYMPNNLIFAMIYAYILDSIAKYNLYGIEDAKKSLVKAIDLAKGDYIITCFVELAPHILPILKELEKENEYAKIILPKCEKFNEIYEKNYCNTKKVELTIRELEVMKLVDEGCKQNEISEKLNIALITVKKHISSVYFKLNVKNKTIAINMLKEKGII